MASDPWASPTNPQHADVSDRLLFEWVGRVMSQWEHVEWQLSLLCARFAEKPHDDAAIQRFGTGTIFRERLNILKRTACDYYIRQANQNEESSFDGLCMEILKASDRRNEVAHGVVFPTNYLPDTPFEGNGWVLVPPYHIGKRFQNGIPTYYYSSKELNRLILKLSALHDGIKNFISFVD